MFELVLAIFVIPKSISPVAKAAGRRAWLWNLFSILVFVLTEILIITGYYVTYGLLAIQWRMRQDAQNFWATPIVYILALVCGLLSVDVIRRYLTRQAVLEIGDPPPPPPTFS